MADVQDAFVKFDAALDQFLAAATAYVVNRSSPPQGATMENFVRVDVAAPMGPGETQLTVDAAVAPYKNPPSAGSLTLADELAAPMRLEIVSYRGVTDNGDGTLTLTGITRGEEGTDPASWVVGDTAFQALTVGAIDTAIRKKLFKNKMLGL